MKYIFHCWKHSYKNDMLIFLNALIRCLMWQLFFHIKAFKLWETETTAEVAGGSCTPAEVMMPPIDSGRPSFWPLTVNSWDSVHVTCSRVSWWSHHILFCLCSSCVPISNLQQCSGCECWAILCSVMKEMISITRLRDCPAAKVWWQARWAWDRTVMSSCCRVQKKKNDHLCN